MSIKLTEDQQNAVKVMVEYAERFADQIYHIMRNHKLNLIDGCALDISIEPELLFITEQVTFGKQGRDSGFIRLSKGRRSINEKFVPYGDGNSAEYEQLFMDPAVRERMQEAGKQQKELPPDGLWLSRYDDPGDVACGEWDINDSLS